jgi:F-type H+-transporting ATPase subunit b
MGLFEALGINLKILLAQLINFSIMIFVLWRFAYKPIMKVLNDRREKIIQGVKAAEKSEEKLAQAEDKEKEIITEAKKEALKIVEEAKERAEKKYQEIINKSKEDIGQIINQEKEKIHQEKETVLVEIRQEIGSLLGMGLNKFLDKKINRENDEIIITEITKELQKK